MTELVLALSIASISLVSIIVSVIVIVHASRLIRHARARKRRTLELGRLVNVRPYDGESLDDYERRVIARFRNNIIQR